MRTSGDIRKIRWAALAAGIAFLAGSAGIASASPQSILKRRTKQVVKLLKKVTTPGTKAHRAKRREMKRIIRSLLDYRELSKRSLKWHWKDRSKDERKEFVGILRQLIEDRVLSNLSSHMNFKVRFDKQRITGRIALVSTTVIIPDKPEVELEYKFFRKGRRWLMFDLITDGTSLVRNYRSQFNRIIRKKGYRYLVRKMRTKLKGTATSGKKLASVSSVAG